MLISIIVPTYNRAAILFETIRSVLEQSYANWELIVVDDGSSDGTEALLRDLKNRDARIDYFARPSSIPKGANTCRNYGVTKARGDLIKWLDSDDMLDPFCLEKQVNRFKESDIDVCFCQTIFFGERDGVIGLLPNRVWGRLEPSSNLVDEYLSGKVRWQTGAGLWRRGFLGDSPFKVGLMNSQEWLMHFKNLLRRPRICFLDEPLCLARKHSGSMSNAKNKRSVYYFNQCMARAEAASLLIRSPEFSVSRLNMILRSFAWNHLFVFYKGGFWKGFTLIREYFRLISQILISTW